jgi:hypothetical protein
LQKILLVLAIALTAGVAGFAGIRFVVADSANQPSPEVFGSAEMGTMVPFEKPIRIMWRGRVGGSGSVIRFTVKWLTWGEHEANGTGTESSNSPSDDLASPSAPWKVSYRAWDIGTQCGVRAYRKLSVIRAGDVQTYEWGNAGPAGCGTFEQPCDTPKPNSFCG